jgi:hypothetical protein
MKQVLRMSAIAGALAGALACTTLAAHAMDHLTPAPEGAEVYIIAPEGGATLSNPVTVQFGLRGMGVAPAGVEHMNTGHHHLLINMPLDQVDLEAALPNDDNHRHFGGGQTEVTLELPAGTHTMQLLVGDHNHIPHNPPIFSDVITVTVE